MFDHPAAMQDTAEGAPGNDGQIKDMETSGADGLVCTQAIGAEGVVVRLENQSVWSRFHRLGTEMILTPQGRRMFPCCRFRLSGLDPALMYDLVMELAPLDDFRHRWNGRTWERDGPGDAHLQRAVCFHPDSPSLGQRWMDGPVSFYKVKLTLSSLRSDTGVPLHSMRRYQPRLLVVPLNTCAERPVPLEGPDVRVFSFPETEFYTVTSYQNPQLTQLKTDCNPFMMLRDDDPSARLIHNKLRLALTGRSPGRLSGNHGNRSNGEKHLSSTHESPSDRKRAAHEELGHRPSVSYESTEDVMMSSSEPAGSLLTTPHSSWQGPGKHCVPLSKPSRPAGGVKRVYRRTRCVRRAKKAKAKWWSNVKYARAAAARAAAASGGGVDPSMQPDLEDVDGVLFVSFTAKEALDVHVGSMRRSVKSSSSSHTEKDEGVTADRPVLSVSSVCADAPPSTEERISEQELLLLQHLRQLKNRQILHPALQQVGMKLNLLDPVAPVDLQYVGVDLPLPSPVLSTPNQLSPSSHVSFVSRTGKTSDLTRIKGWMEKFSVRSRTSAADSSVNSAFCSDMLDEYLESEGQRISERAAVFSSSAPAPVVYQLPVRSSSYVRTLDSVLQTRASAVRRPAKAPPPRLTSARIPSERSLQGRHPSEPAAGAAKVRSRRGRKRRRPQLKFNREAIDGSLYTTCAKKRCELLTQEEHAVRQGHSPVLLTPERAGFALNALITAEKTVSSVQFGGPSAPVDECEKAFCWLGCICDSLNREPAGSTHCGRVQCMLGCGCFRHKILLIRSSESTTSLKALRPGSDVRPEPALRVTRLWNSSVDKSDKEPLYTPKPAGAPRPTPRLPTHTPRAPPQAGRCQTPAAEKDLVYLYLESMMTCARVREYNSNPPPQVHLLPAQRSDTPRDTSPLRLSEGQPAALSSEAGEPEPMKVLEIISGCNWEPHRSLMLKQLFRCVSTNRLSSVVYIDIYKVELLSKKLRRDKTSSTLTYKVNGKTYAQAKLLLGRMGALHPANRLAAFVTGRIKTTPSNANQSRSAFPSNSVTQANQSEAAFKVPAHHALKHMTVLHTVAPPLTGVLLTPPLSDTVVPASALPPGQQVVLQPVAGMNGVNMCQFNGQMIQLVPVSPALHMQTSTANSGSAQSQTAAPLPQTKPLPFIMPRIHCVPGRTSFTIGGSSSARGGQSGLLNKTGAFSFRICPPTAESLEPTGKPQESGETPSTLLLPGGYKLIKLPVTIQPDVSLSSAPQVTNKLTENSQENPETHQSSVPIKSEPAETLIKVEPLQTDESEEHKNTLLIKVEPHGAAGEPPNAEHPVKTEHPEVSHSPTAQIRHGDFCFDFPCVAPLYRPTAPSALAHTGAGEHTDTHRPHAKGKHINWLWRGRAALSSDPDGGLTEDRALIYSSDGWTTDDSSEQLSEEEVDIETFEESDEVVCRLRARARWKTPQTVKHRRLRSVEFLAGVAHHSVRLMSDLPLYKRSWRLNQELKDRKRRAELRQSLASLRRALGITRHLCVEELLRQAHQMVTELEDHSRFLVARKRTLIRQHSHYQRLICQRSEAGTEVCVVQKTDAPPAETASRLPNIVLQGFGRS